MIFIFKRSAVTVDLFTTRSNVFNFSKLDSATKFFPQWWKNLPNKTQDDFFPHSTMKHCHGLIDLYKKSFCIPMWSDLVVEVGQEGTTFFRYQYSDLSSEATSHHPKQTNNRYSEDKFLHLKLVTPWKAREKTGVDFLIHSPFYNLKNFNDFTLPPGVINFKYQNSLNINIFFNRQKEDKIINIDFDDPMVFLTPLTDKKVKLKHHLVTEQELSKIEYVAQSIKFVNSYKSIRNKINEKKSSCPFGFK